MPPFQNQLTPEGKSAMDRLEKVLPMYQRGEITLEQVIEKIIQIGMSANK